MNDDIVTRLREHQNSWYPLDEAADEIERLRVVLKMTETRANRWRDRAIKAEGQG